MNTPLTIPEWTRLFTAALTIQKDGVGIFFITDENIADAKGVYNDRIGELASRGIDPIEFAYKASLKYRKFYSFEIQEFRKEFERLLKAELVAEQKFTEANLRKYTNPCTVKAIVENLQKGSTPSDFLDRLYCNNPFNEWSF